MTLMNLFISIALLSSAIAWLYGMIIHKSDTKEPEWISYARGTFFILLIIFLVKIMNIDILTLLTILTFGSLFIWLLHRFGCPKRHTHKKEPFLVEYSRSLFPIFAIVLVIRAFVFQPFHIPTGSLEPTILPNEFVIVSQFAYGLKLPITYKKIVRIGTPKRGDIVVFPYPVNPNLDLIKRVIGLPGDHITYRHNVLTINGKKIKQTFLRNGVDIEPEGNIPSRIMIEDLDGVKHKILLHKGNSGNDSFSITVPKGHYFMMGDNRNNSADSRVWGFVSEKNIIGKAWLIWMSWDKGIRWNRIGTKL